MQPRLYLVDGSMYVFRAWHAMPPDFVDTDGRPVSAVHGFVRFLCELLERTAASHMLVAFDGSLNTSFRNDIYPPYKANREPPPAELEHQFDLCRQMTRAMGVPMAVDDRYEADDLIGTAAWMARSAGFANTIVSADKDFGQLIGHDDEQWDYARNRRWSYDGVHERLGVYPPQVADYLALCGDSIDNIPGVPGIGAKTAATLLAHFESLDALLERVDEVPFLSMRGAKSCARKLREHADAVRDYRRLTRIALDAPMAGTMDALQRTAPDDDALAGLTEQLCIGPLTRRRLEQLDPANRDNETPS